MNERGGQRAAVIRRQEMRGTDARSNRAIADAVLAEAIRISSILLQNPSRFQLATYTLMDVIETVAFQRFAAHKTREATIASIERLSTAFDRRDDSGLLGIGNAWSRLHYGGEFGLVRPSRSETAVSLVFIQTKDGNTGGPNPSAFGGGATDTHLIYEGLSRVRPMLSLLEPAASIGMRSSPCGIRSWSRYARRSDCDVTRLRSSCRSAAGSTSTHCCSTFPTCRYF